MFSVFLDTLRAGTIFTPLSSLLLKAMNLAMVTNSRSSRSSLLKVVLLIAEPGHL